MPVVDNMQHVTPRTVTPRTVTPQPIIIPQEDSLPIIIQQEDSLPEDLEDKLLHKAGTSHKVVNILPFYRSKHM